MCINMSKTIKEERLRWIMPVAKKIVLWNTKYNDLKHCGLNGKTPNEFLNDYQLTNPPKALA